MTHLLHLTGTWIEVLVNSVAESHDTEGTVLVLGLGDILGYSVLRLDLIKHFEACLIGTTMSWAPE
jgi:hypothetical protein